MTDESRKHAGGRKPTGTVAPLPDGRLQGIITVHGRRKRLPPFPRGTSQAMAEERTLARAQKAAAEPAPQVAIVSADDKTPGGEWFATWLADRVARGYSTTRDNDTHWRIYIQPALGSGSPKTWQREQFRKLSSTLDAKVQADELSWKSAQNVWATATKMANDASESKVAALRVRDDDPASGVRGPDKGDEVGKQFLYPAEFLRFVQHPKVPKLWKRLVTVAIYTYLRDGELRALECRDVDLEHGVIRVTKAWNRNLKRVTSPKGGKARDVPIEPALVPLLKALKAERGDTGLLLEMPGGSNSARALTTWLKAAGVDRHELLHETPTTRPIRFHDLRGTGITWRAVRNDPKFELQIDAGHVDFSTTEKYLHLASARRRGFGDPFPALPAAVSIRESITLLQVREIENESEVRTGFESTADQKTPGKCGETAPDEQVSPPGSEQPNPAEPGGRSIPDERNDRPGDVVEAALGTALAQAAAAGQWEVVARLAGELEARRKARATTVDLATERAKRGRS